MTLGTKAANRGQTLLPLLTFFALLHLVLQRWELEVVKCQIEEDGLTSDWLELGWEWNEIGLRLRR